VDNFPVSVWELTSGVVAGSQMYWWWRGNATQNPKNLRSI